MAIVFACDGRCLDPQTRQMKRKNWFLFTCINLFSDFLTFSGLFFARWFFKSSPRPCSSGLVLLNMFCSFALRVFVFHSFTNADKAEKSILWKQFFLFFTAFVGVAFFLKSTRKILVSELICMFTLLIAALIFSAGYYSAPIFFLLRRIKKFSLYLILPPFQHFAWNLFDFSRLVSLFSHSAKSDFEHQLLSKAIQNEQTQYNKLKSGIETG